MKRYPAKSLQTCFSRIMPVVAVLGFSCAVDVTAKDAVEKKETVSMQSETTRYFSAQEEYVLKSLAMASKAIENNDYEKALKILDISKQIIDYAAQSRQCTITDDLKKAWDDLFVELGADEYEKCVSILKKINSFTKDAPKGMTSLKIHNMREKWEALKKICTAAYAEVLYKSARDNFINALSEKDAVKAANDAKKIRSALNAALYMHYTGSKYGKEQNLKKAIALGNPAFYDKVLSLQKQCNKISNYKDFIDKTSLESQDPAYKDNQLQIHKLYRQGELLYRKRKFTEARDKMEQILILDPYNDKAISMLSRIYRKLYMIADMRIYNEFLQEQALIEWRWVENVPAKSMEQDDTPREYTGNNSPLYEKTKSIMIPSINFEQYTVRQAAEELEKKSQQNDPEGAGVSITLLNAKKGGNFFDKKISFSLQNVPLLVALRYLCLHAGLKFRVDEIGKIVVIGLADEIIHGNTFIQHEFPIRRVTVDRMIDLKVQTTDKEKKSATDDGEFSVDGAFEDNKVEDTFKTGVGAQAAELPDYSPRLKQYLINLGFTFPEGTSVGYDVNSSRLTLKHTPEVLRKIELFLKEIDIDTPLVLMEAKIMEISMNDLEELGFDWTLTHQNTNERWSFAVGSPIRTPINSSTSVLINNMNILPNFGGDNVWNLFLTVYALDQTDRSEVLSSPKIIASNGTVGSIRMVREMYFPEDWDEPQIGTSCGSSVTLEPSIPNFGDKRDVGIIFSATPKVSPNNYTIDLKFEPEVTDLIGWSDYSYDIVLGNFGTPADGSTDQSTGGTTGALHATLKMPELSRRSVVTNVKVYDGQTVMVGGMLVDHQARRDDQWPILGDIPLLGRLFTMDSFSGKKHNLLISVTSRLIGGDGSPIRPNPTPGVPDFRR